MYSIGSTVGDYKILAGPLGHEPSGFGEVYKALHLISPSKEVALKFSSKTDADSISRFEQENRILKLLNGHIGIIKTNSDIISEVTTGTKYYSMELADSNIAQYLILNPSSAVDEKIMLFKQICEALRYAHDNEVVHRDMHYGNILLVNNGSSLQIKITDFGRAKHFVQNSQYPAGLVWGRQDTRAPESYFHIWSVADRSSYALSSDIYSMGILLSFLFGVDSTRYLLANSMSLARYVLDNNIGTVSSNLHINIRQMPAGDSLYHYGKWTPTFDYESESSNLRVVLQDQDINKIVNKIIKKCCEPNYADRYASVDDIIEEMESIC